MELGFDLLVDFELYLVDFSCFWVFLTCFGRFLSWRSVFGGRGVVFELWV